MKSEAIFDRIIVLESLSDSDEKTGRHLFESVLLHVEAVNGDLTSEYISVANPDEFISQIRRISSEVERSEYRPLLHIECHGCQDGLEMEDGKLLRWNRLRNELIRLNIATRMNLIIVVAACSGMYLIDTSSHMDGAPFLGVISTQGKVLSGQIKDRMKMFYKKIIETKNGDSAVAELNVGIGTGEAKFKFQSSMALFVNAFYMYYSEYCKGKGKNIRREQLISRLMQDSEVKKNGIKFARKKVKEMLENPEDHFQFFYQRFFFVNTIEESKERFPLTFQYFEERYNESKK